MGEVLQKEDDLQYLKEFFFIELNPTHTVATPQSPGRGASH